MRRTPQAITDEATVRRSMRPVQRALGEMFAQLDAALAERDRAVAAAERYRARLIAQCDGDLMAGRL